MQLPDYFISSEDSLLDTEFVVSSLQTTYWAATRPREIILESIQCSLCFGAYVSGTNQQVGFARVVTDGLTFSWLCDVVIDPRHRSRGLGKRLVTEVIAHPKVGRSRVYLITRDAHGLYEGLGFKRSEAMRWSLEPPGF